MNPPTTVAACLGVGIDTSRYGHHVTILRPDLQPACPALEIRETRQGYQQLLDRLRQLDKEQPGVRFLVRLDAAGQYAANLLAFLNSAPGGLEIVLSVGDPQRNQNYRKTHFPRRKADATESYCAARYALLEQPLPMPAVPASMQALREVAGRLEAETRQTTRVVNQLHNLLARVFPELAMLVRDLAAGWVMRLLARYPTPAKLARAHRHALEGIRYLPHDIIDPFQAAARDSVASCRGELAEQLVRDLVALLRRHQESQNRLEKLLVQAYRALPESNHLPSIPGIGEATAAVVTAKMVSIDRFPTPDHLVGYFGTFPEEDSSGVDAKGQARPGLRMKMSKRGNDLVRKYLWNAAMAASRSNPAVRALSRRQRQRNKEGGVALGHAMRKLLHLVFAVWKTGRPFDPAHYPWESPRLEKEAAGRKGELPPERQAVTAATSTVRPSSTAVKAPPAPPAPAARPKRSRKRIDFAALRAQVNMEQVLRRLDLLNRLRGRGPQLRGPCPVCGGDDPQARSFSVHLGKNVFRCLDPQCGIPGNTLDLWMAVHRLPLYDAALHLANTFHLDLTPDQTEKRQPVQPKRRVQSSPSAAPRADGGVITLDAP